MRLQFNPSTSRRSGWKGLLFFALFWCTFTGVFVGFSARNFWRAADAQARYVPVEGVVLESRVTHNSDSDGTTYGFGIRYRYTVDGRNFESNRYAFGSGSSSDGYSRASQLVDRHPAGSKITVFRDPAKPQEAVIDRQVDPAMWFMLLFLQPFVLVGIVGLGALVAYPFNRRRMTSFVQRPANVPWTIPSWGTLERRPEGLVLQPKARASAALGAVLLGYGLVNFLSIFVVGFFFGGFAGVKPHTLAGAFGASLLGGVAGAVLYPRSLRAKARLVLDPGAGLFKLTSPLRTVEIAFNEISGWGIKPILNPRSMRQDGQSAYVPLLSVYTTRGDDVPVHIFGAGDDDPAVARKVADTFAAWTNKPVFEEPQPGVNDALNLMTARGALAAAREIKAAAAQLKDLC